MDDFGEFVGTRSRGLQRTAWLLTGDWAAAEDLVQTTLAKCWSRWGRVANADHPDAYVRRVMVTTFLGWRRRRWTGEHPVSYLPDVAAPGDPFGAADLRDSLVAALRDLPARQRAEPPRDISPDTVERQGRRRRAAMIAIPVAAVVTAVLTLLVVITSSSTSPKRVPTGGTVSLGALRLTYPATWHADVPEQRRFDAVPRVQPLLTGARVLSTEPFVRMCSRPGFGVAGVCYRSVRLGADGIVVGLSTFHDATYSTYHVLDQRVAGRPAEFGDHINTAGTCPLGTGSATYAVVALGHARYASAFACLGTKATGAEDEFRTMLATATYRP